MATSRVSRGRKTQELVAEYFRKRGWPSARSSPASIPGRDILHMPGLAPEVKASNDKNFSMTSALRQAAANAGDDLPFVIYRPRGFGPENIGKWVVFMDLDRFTSLLQRDDA